jgi:hypothetical protein
MAVVLLACTGGLVGTGHYTWAGGPCGTNCCCELYDCCWPQRYTYQARLELNAAFAPQVQNGHVLDQTVWNHHFEPCTDHLTPGGQAHLAYLARRRPCPDTTIYLQTGNDLPYDCACPDQSAAARQDLDTRRIQAIQKYLVAYTAGRPVDFQVLVHDPSDPTIAAIPAANALTQMYLGFRGVLARPGGLGGAGAVGGAGATGVGAAGAVPTR